MTIYQLDAWVFEDKLEYWCDKNYDYIGAPWFEGYDTADENSEMLPVAGNGGFSLRKISSILKVLSADYNGSKSFKQIYNWNKTKGRSLKILNYSICLFKYLFQNNYFVSHWERTKMFEDCVFVTYGPKVYKDFKLAPPEVALEFSFEVLPRKLYEINNNKLPFGCHAFEKYDYDFWKPFINM